MLHVCGVFGGLRGSAVDLFLSSALSQFVFSSLTVSLERDEIQLSTPLFLFILPPPPLSLSLAQLLYQFPVPVEATNVSAICAGANSLVIVICVSLLLRKS